MTTHEMCNAFGVNDTDKLVTQGSSLARTTLG
jgi:hypothetical protein